MFNKLAAHSKKIRRIHKHPFIVPVLTFLVLFFATGIGFIAFNGQTVGASDTRIVSIYDNGKLETFPTRAPSVGELLKRLNITINDHDVVEPSLDTPILEDGFRVNIYRAHPVTIIDGDHKVATLTADHELRQTVKDSGLNVYPEDAVRVADVEEVIKNGVIGQQLVIDRATPMTINLYGNVIAVRTHAKTVSDVLKEKNVITQPGDMITPAPTTPIASNTAVFVVSVGKQITTTDVTIDMPIQYVNDSTLAAGATAIRQSGSPGKKVVTYEIELQNGKEVSRKVLQEVIATPAVPQIVVRGTKLLIGGDKLSWMQAAGISSNDYLYVDYIVGNESGWCPTKWQGEWGGCPAYHGTPSSSYTGYGLCQATPGYKMSTAGADWGTNPVTQLNWCSGYAQSAKFNAYGGGWYGAYNYWRKYHNW